MFRHPFELKLEIVNFVIEGKYSYWLNTFKQYHKIIYIILFEYYNRVITILAYCYKVV